MASETTVLDILSRIRAEQAELQEKMTRTDEDVRALERTLELIRSLKEQTPAPREPHLATEYAGMSQEQAVEHLARLQDGVVTVTQAKRMLVETGLTKSTKAYQVASNRITRKGRFDWIAPGTYRLKEQPANGHHPEEPDELMQSRRMIS